MWNYILSGYTIMALQRKHIFLNYQNKNDRKTTKNLSKRFYISYK